VGGFVISFAYKMQVFGDLESLGVAGLAFTVPDTIVPGIIIWLIARLFGVR
jgi:ascorbate PTS system EIIC component